MPTEKGNNVKVEYTGTFDDGTIFDASSKHGQLLEFEVGAGLVIAGFDDAVLGMEVGQEKEVKIPADKAYGQKDAALIQKIPKDKFPEGGKNITVGTLLAMGMPSEEQIPVMVTEISEDTITLDLNHPLAGKDLTFKIKLVEVH